MGTPLPADLMDRTTAAALEEKKKLQKHFKRFDILFFMICTLVGLDTLGAVASNGAQAFTWLIFLGVLYFVPYAMLMSELGGAFPEEGGPYVWTRLAFGRLVGALTAILYWVSNPIWVGGTLTITAIATFSDFFFKLSTVGEYVFALAFIWFTIIMAILSFQVGKWIPTIGAWVRMVVLSFFSLSMVMYAIKHGVHGFGLHAFFPTYAIFIAAVPVLFFNYEGFELPSAAGEEMTNPQRDVPFAILRSGIGTVLMYGVPILLILLVLPTGQVSSLGGFIDAAKIVFTVWGGHVAADGTATLTGFGNAMGHVAAVAFILALISSGTTWIIGADRTQAVAGYDGAGPRVLGRFSRRFGTPIVVNLMSGVTSTIFMVLAFQLTSGNAAKYFAVVLGLVISTTTISYLAIFPALIKLRYSHPHVERPYRVPGGMVGIWIAGVLTTFWALLATVALLWPGFLTSDPNASLPSGFTRSQYELSQLVPLLILFALGVVFYWAGGKTRGQMVEIPLAEQMGVGAVS